MRLLLFLIKKKITSTFFSDYISYVILSMVLIFGTVNGWLLSRLFELGLKNNLFIKDDFFYGLNFSISMLILIIDIFPRYATVPTYLPSYYPLKSIYRVLFSLILQFIRHNILFYHIVICALFSFSHIYGLENMIFTLIFIYISFIFNRIIKYIPYNNFKNKLSILISSFIIYISNFYIYSNIEIYGIKLLPILLVILVLLFMILSYLYTKKKIKNKFSVITELIKNPLIKVLLHPKIKIPYILGMIFKIFMVTSIILALRYKKDPMFNSYLQWLFVSPVIYFTYFGLNFFGLNKKFYFTHIIREHRINNLANAYIFCMMMIITIDSIMYFTYLLLTENFSIENIVFYYTISILLIIMGFFFSVKKPKFVAEVFSFKINTSMNSNISSIMVTFMVYSFFYFIKNTPYQLLSSFFLIAVSLILILNYKFNTLAILRNSYSKLIR